MTTNDYSFNVLSVNEFWNLESDDVLEVVSAGIGVNELDNPVLDFSLPSDTIDDICFEIENSDGKVSLSSYISRDMVSEMVVDPDAIDEHGFTQADYDRSFSNGNNSFSGGSSLSYGLCSKKVADFPLEPGGMTLDFSHEWVMIKAGRMEELIKELHERLQVHLDVLMDGTTTDKNGVVTTISDSLLNEKLATYAKLGMVEELKALAEEHDDKLDFCQTDKCGVTLIGRMCIWPCSGKSHAYCRVIEFLISKLKDPVNDLNKQSFSQLTSALMIAVKLGETCKVNMLVKCGAFVNMQNRNGSTALLIATKRGYADIIRILLAHGANPSAINLDVPCPLELASLKRDNEILSLLRDYYHKLSGELRDVCSEVFRPQISLQEPISPLFCANLRESSNFSFEFMAEGEAFVNRKGWANFLFVVCIQQDDGGQFRLSRKGTVIKAVRLNGVKQTTVMRNRQMINVYVLKFLRRLSPNQMELRFRDLSKDSKAKLLVQAYACDLSRIHSPLDNTHGSLDQSVPMRQETLNAVGFVDNGFSSAESFSDRENAPPEYVFDAENISD